MASYQVVFSGLGGRREASMHESNEQKKEWVLSFADSCYVALGEKGEVAMELTAGSIVEVWIDGQWQAVKLHSSGYRGLYYITMRGERGRLAISMRLRPCHVVATCNGETATPSLEQVRQAWIGKAVRSVVPMAGGYVSGHVQAITHRGVVIFVYTSRLNGVPVKATFPVERLGEVLTLAF